MGNGPNQSEKSVIAGNLENVLVAQEVATKMAWERRGNQHYFYRSVRCGGKVKKIYYGRGDLAMAAAESLELARLGRERRKEAMQSQRGRYEEADAVVAGLGDELDRLIDAEWMVAKTGD